MDIEARLLISTILSLEVTKLNDVRKPSLEGGKSSSSLQCHLIIVNLFQCPVYLYGKHDNKNNIKKRALLSFLIAFFLQDHTISVDVPL